MIPCVHRAPRYTSRILCNVQGSHSSLQAPTLDILYGTKDVAATSSRLFAR